MTYSYPPPPSTPPYPAGGFEFPPGHLRGYRLLWIALIAFIIAVALFVAGGIVIGTKSFGRVNGFHRVTIAGGGGTVTLNGTGKWIGYYEAGDVTSSIDRIPAFRAAVTSPSGTSVTLTPYGDRSDGKVKKLTYDFNGHKGAAAFQFIAPEKGTYTLRLAAVDQLPSNAKVAVGRDIVGGTVAGGALILGGILLIVAAIVLLIIGLIRRGRHKNQLAPAGYYGAQPPQQQWPPQQQPWPAQPPQQQWPPQQQQWPAQPPQQQWPVQPPPQQPWPAGEGEQPR